MSSIVAGVGSGLNASGADREQRRAYDCAGKPRKQRIGSGDLSDALANANITYVSGGECEWGRTDTTSLPGDVCRLAQVADGKGEARKNATNDNDRNTTDDTEQMFSPIGPILSSSRHYKPRM